MALSDLIDTLENADAGDVNDFLGDVFAAIEDSGIEEELQERTGLMLAAVIPALIWQRENEDMTFDEDTVIELFGLESIAQLAQITDLPDALRENLDEYLALPEDGHADALDVFLDTIEA